jgi:hypothetical protein
MSIGTIGERAKRSIFFRYYILEMVSSRPTPKIFKAWAEKAKLHLRPVAATSFLACC